MGRHRRVGFCVKDAGTHVNALSAPRGGACARGVGATASGARACRQKDPLVKCGRHALERVGRLEIIRLFLTRHVTVIRETWREYPRVYQGFPSVRREGPGPQ